METILLLLKNPEFYIPLILLLLAGLGNIIWHWAKKEKPNCNIEGSLIQGDHNNTNSNLVQGNKMVNNIGGDSVQGDKIINQQVNSPNTLEVFRNHLQNSNWTSVNGGKFYRCDQDATYQIHFDDYDNWKECDLDWEFLKKFPSHEHKYLKLSLMINGAVIDSLSFLYLDGQRVLVPYPKTDEDGVLYWDSKSLEFDVAEAIREYESYNFIYKVAEKGIQIR
jgi:hypothetical protein